jgi:predicted nucleotidyltransferase
MFQRKEEYFEFVSSAKAALKDYPLNSSGFAVEVTGSLSRGELRPPYSDIDLLLVCQKGYGVRLRDEMVRIAGSLNTRLLTIFVDPFSSDACFCSIYSGPLKVDWLTAEEEVVDSRPVRTIVWRGDNPPPYDWKSHPWDWIWWLWCKLCKGDINLVRTDLPRLWQFLVLRGTEPRSFPDSIRSSVTSGELQTHLLATLDLLPAQETPLAVEIRRGIEQARAMLS